MFYESADMLIKVLAGKATEHVVLTAQLVSCRAQIDTIILVRDKAPSVSHRNLNVAILMDYVEERTAKTQNAALADLLHMTPQALSMWKRRNGRLLRSIRSAKEDREVSPPPPNVPLPSAK